MRLDDKDILTDCLADSKYYSHAYHFAALESSNDQIRNTFLRLMNDELSNAKMLFDAMHQRGWYPVDMARSTAAGMHAQHAPGAGARQEYTTPGMQGFHTGQEPGYGAQQGDPTHRW
ncbi:MAG: spore coat protein [Ammonifex sp.]|jgi:spore coat protein CotF|nr:MAG: spore coat protein [Ammonifex sp.]